MERKQYNNLEEHQHAVLISHSLIDASHNSFAFCNSFAWRYSLAASAILVS